MRLNPGRTLARYGVRRALTGAGASYSTSRAWSLWWVPWRRK